MEEIKQLSEDNTEAIKVLSEQIVNMQEQITKFKGLVESRIVKIEEDSESNTFERDTSELRSRNMSLPAGKGQG